MKLKLFACLVVGAMVSVTSAVAAPEFDTFLSVDINGYQWADGSGVPGPTQAGFLPWNVVADDFGLESGHDAWDAATNLVGITEVFATSMGNVTVEMTGHTSGLRSARDRGTSGGPLAEVRRDFVFAARTHDGFGQEWIKLELSGLEPGKNYEFTGIVADTFNGNGDPTMENSSFQAWSDLARLSGLDGPGAYMDAVFGADSVYQPAVGGVNNLIPRAGRAPISGPAPGDGEDYRYSLSFRSRADSNGVVTVYTWADPNGYSGTQTATLMNGFQLGCAPEPGTMALFGLGLIGIAGLRRRGQ